jgi:nucleoside-diphosphate-sugar epimerase
MAAPVSLSFTDPVPVLHGAVNGTKTILSSAYRNAGLSLKHFVLTSSIAAILNDYPPGYVYTEKDWNTVSLPRIQKLGKEALGPDIYRASKTASETATIGIRKGKEAIVYTCCHQSSFRHGTPIGSSRVT